MEWSVNWHEYYDAECPKEITEFGTKRVVSREELIGKRIIGFREYFGELIFITED